MKPTCHFRWKQIHAANLNINTQQAIRIGDTFLYQMLQQWWENEEEAGGEWRPINVAPQDDIRKEPTGKERGINGLSNSPQKND